MIHEPRRGYGSAYLAGLAAARGCYVVMADADGTYPIESIPSLIAYADRFDMVVGARHGKYYRQSPLKEFLRDQPAPDWNGVYTHKSK